MIRSLLIILVLAISCFGQTNVGGIITADITWDQTGSPYLVTANTLIDSGVTVTIEAGVLIKIDSNTSINIFGELIAIGNEGNRIVFTSNQTSPVSGDWGQINFVNGVDAQFDSPDSDLNFDRHYVSGSILKYVTIQYGGYGDPSGALYLLNTVPYLDNVIIANNLGSGIYGINSGKTLTINKSNISNNTRCGIELFGGLISDSLTVTENESYGIFVSDYWWAINASTVQGNGESGFYSSVYYWHANNFQARIINSTFNGNGGWGINSYHDCQDTQFIINNNIVKGNEEGGIRSHGGWFSEGSEISGNIVENNNGTGIYSWGSDPTHTISNNLVYNNAGHGIHEAYQQVRSTIEGNRVIQNQGIGIKGGDIDNPAESGTYYIFNNAVLYNTQAGIYCTRTAIIDSNTVYLNNALGDPMNAGISVQNPSSLTGNNVIQGNSYAIRNTTQIGAGNIDAIDNYWGHTNVDSIANSIYDWNDNSNYSFVNFEPFLTTPNISAPPIPVQNLHITNFGVEFIDLAWNESTIGDIAGYRIYYTTNANGGTYDDTLDVGLVTSYTLSGLSAGYDYTIVVTCYDTDGNESWYSNEVQVTPQPAPIINVNPVIIDFSTLMVGEARSMDLSISNSGTDVLSVSDILQSTENIAVSSNTLDIPVGGETTISINLTPSQYGLSADTLLIQNNSFNNPGLQVPIQWFGDLPESPVILSVSDIPDDQGGQARITFAGSKYDGYDNNQAITSYSIWRFIEGDSWDAISSFNAVQDSIYHVAAPTLCDSTGEGICWSTFQISAHTSNAEIYYHSNSLDGYSVDNIAPSTPSGFMAAGIEGGIQLTWNSVPEEDFQYYAIYRSTQFGFNPDTMNAPQYTSIDVSLTDINLEFPGTYYYRIVAFDYAGNESEYSEQVSATIVSIASRITLPTEYILDQNYPNPFNPSTTIKYGLPEDSNVSLVIYDVRGQVVQALESGHQSAGWYDVVWNGQTADGKTISTGIYFVRLVAGDYSQVIKMLYLK
ncbi:MAG: T9SS type A sorting domain-containing protein [Candidatus Marinimicrobia bacterium]|nr:T9SS type A sorting domain-containing protein [Candidatus Neomarinimicrobiota bacterium]